jgi:hypothetical protein
VNAQHALSQEGRAIRRLWLLTSAGFWIPLTAMLHHLVFHRPNCMLQYFGPEWDFATFAYWLWTDPSPWVAALGVMALRWGSERFPAIRSFAGRFFVSFLPLSLWIWDIPGTGRAICAHFHDGKVEFAVGVPLRALHLYLVCSLIFVAWSVIDWRRRSTARQGAGS